MIGLADGYADETLRDGETRRRMQDGGRRGALVSETHESARHTNMPEVACVS